jgi:hypothetical protein
MGKKLETRGPDQARVKSTEVPTVNSTAGRRETISDSRGCHDGSGWADGLASRVSTSGCPAGSSDTTRAWMEGWLAETAVPAS